MARGLQIITPHNQSYSEEEINSTNDIIIVQAQDNPTMTLPSSNGHSFSSTDASITSLESQSNGVGNHENEVTSSSSPSSSRPRDLLSSIVSHVGVGSQPSLEETRAAGQVLFKHFIQQCISREVDSPLNLDIMEDAIPDEVPEDINRVMHTTANTCVNGYAHPRLSAFARDLRKIAEKFEESQERLAIRNKAEEVDLDGIRYEEFKSLLCNFFDDGSISRSRIIVLFFFCSDLARRALMNGTINLFRQLFTWSIAFIMGSVCSWVQNQGGWGVVLGDYVPKLAVTLCAFLGCAAFAVYIKKNL